jgi:hypothetical protein
VLLEQPPLLNGQEDGLDGLVDRQHAIHHEIQSRAGPTAIVHDDLRDTGQLGRDLDVVGDEPLQQLDWIRLRDVRQQRSVPFFEFAHEVIDRRPPEIFLGTEVMANESVGRVGIRCDLAETRTVETLLREVLHRGLEKGRSGESRGLRSLPACFSRHAGLDLSCGEHVSG